MVKLHRVLTVAALAAGIRVQAQAGPDCPLQPTSLKAMLECYRPVLVFAPSARDVSFIAQQRLLDQYADDMMDRNLLYVPVLMQPAHFERPLDSPYVLLGQKEMNAIRARFGISASEFAVLLIGKDGGEKFRWRKPVSVLKLDELVDAMPMGRQEKDARSRAAQ
jgi:hypothetical protein